MRRPRKPDKRPSNRRRVNQQIRISPVQVIRDGENLGEMPVKEALRLAEDSGLDLVEVSPNTRPPVCRVMDYGKFLYEQGQREKKQRKNVKQNQLKEIRFRPVTDEHDMEVKIRAVSKFLKEGHRVQLNMRFKRREIMFKNKGYEILEKVVEEIAEIGKMTNKPSMQGRMLSCVIEPIKGE